MLSNRARADSMNENDELKSARSRIREPEAAPRDAPILQMNDEQ
jgi:hypothetical protein